MGELPSVSHGELLDDEGIVTRHDSRNSLGMERGVDGRRGVPSLLFSLEQSLSSLLFVLLL